MHRLYYKKVSRFKSSLGVAATLLLFTGCDRGSHPGQIGTSAPGFTVTDSSRTVRLADYHGKVVILNFWASWCAPCAAESPILETAERQLAADGQGTVLGVTYKDFTNDSLAFIRSHGLTYPSLRDSSGALANAFGTEALPETFVLDRDSRVVAISRGEITQQSFLTEAIAKAEQA